MKYKIQINGVNTEPYKIANFDLDMIDSEYEFEAELDTKNLAILENVLERVIDDNESLFNYSICEKRITLKQDLKEIAQLEKKL